MNSIVLLAALAVAPPVDPVALESHLIERVAASYDSAAGAFVSKGGVPSEGAAELALQLGPPWSHRGLASIRWTRSLFDSVGGGFVDGVKDADPSSPMFAKHTVPNARRLENLILAWRATGDESFRREAVQVADYFERVLKDGRGGFVAGQAGDRELMPEANGVAIHAWLEWSTVSRDRRLLQFSLQSLDRSWEACWSREYGMLRRGVFGELLERPRLVDQVEMGRAYLLGAHYGQRAIDLQRAREIGDHVLERYEDPEKGGFITQAVPKKDGKVKRSGREADENAHAARFLAELSILTGDRKYREAARRTWEAFGPKLDDAGLEAADWALAMRAVGRGFPPPPTWIEPTAQQTVRKKSFRIRVRK